MACFECVGYYRTPKGHREWKIVERKIHRSLMPSILREAITQLAEGGQAMPNKVRSRNEGITARKTSLLLTHSWFGSHDLLIQQLCISFSSALKICAYATALDGSILSTQMCGTKELVLII